MPHAPLSLLPVTLMAQLVVCNPTPPAGGFEAELMRLVQDSLAAVTGPPR